MSSSRRPPGWALLSVLLWAAGLSGAARGADFAGGSGEPNDPYQIATAAQLTAITSQRDLIEKCYVLVADIDLSGTARHDPLIDTFMGTFDGNGHTMRNLRIEYGSRNGLFGTLWPGSEVRNLGIVDAYVRGGGMCGALAASSNGRVVNCYSTGTVIGGDHTGGLVGMNWKTVANSYSAAAVTGGLNTGGLVGHNTGEVSSCHSTGDVTGDRDVGGLVGSNMSQITSSYSTGAVTGLTGNVGGLVGTNFSKIVSCYAEATVLSYDMHVGGLVGQNMGAVWSCYSAGSVSGEDVVGGLAGYSGGPGGIATSYSVADVTDHSYSRHIGGLVGAGSAPRNCYFLAPPKGSGPDNGIGTPLTSVEMMQQASFENWDFWGDTADGTADPWFMPENAYPVLAWQANLTGLLPIPDVTGLPVDQARAALTEAGFVPGAVSYDTHRSLPDECVIHTDPHTRAPAGATVNLILSSGGSYDWTQNPGDGTAANPHRIETAGQLETLSDHPELWDRHFVLQADLDMTGRTYEKALIAPDADRTASGFQGTPFHGVFQGQGHAIRHLTIRRVNDRHDYVGLFGMIGPSARVEGLHVLDADVEGGSGSSSYVGVLAGYNAGTISGCSVTGTLRGGKGDGLVGFSDGSLIDCHADVTRF